MQFRFVTSAVLIGAVLVARSVFADDTAGSRVDRLATFKAGASLQGLEIAKDGSVYVSVNADDVIARVSPDGRQTEFAKLPIHPHGLLATADGFIVAGQTNRFAGDAATPAAQRFGSLDGRVLVLDKSGHVKKSIPVGAATFPNGIAALTDGTYLVADSVADVVWRVNAKTGTVTTWSSDPFLHADPAFPGANGIKVANGWVYVSNTVKQQVARIKLGRNNVPEGAFVVVGPASRVDEIAVARDGTVYAATHGAMAKISPSGEASTAFDDIAGGSALKLAADQKSLYVVTDGVDKNGARGETHLLRIWLSRP